MTRRSSFSIRFALVALISSVALVTGGVAGPASATGTPGTSPALSVRGIAGQPFSDPACPRDPEFPDGINQRQLLIGLVSSHIGPAGLKLDVCRVFVGAIGGMSIDGSFTLLTLAGTLRGHVQGTVGFSQSDNYNLVLTVERGSFLLSKVRGTLTFGASVTYVGDWNPFNGTLATDLHFGSHPVKL